MGVRKQKMTIDDHRRLGNELKQFKAKWMDILYEVKKNCPKKSRAFRLSTKITHAIMILRSEMEEDLFIQFPNEADTTFYYGAEV